MTDNVDNGPKILMNVRFVVTEQSDGKRDIRVFKDGVRLDEIGYANAEPADVGDCLVEAMMACAVEHGLDAKESEDDSGGDEP